MKLRRELIERIAGRLAAAVISEGLASGRDRAGMQSLLAGALTEDLMVEDRLNDEVREILRQHVNEMDRANVEHHEIFKKIKAKLVRDRNLIL
ncbi:MAG: DUF507 family protein [Acidobacteriota bacterium]